MAAEEPTPTSQELDPAQARLFSALMAEFHLEVNAAVSPLATKVDAVTTRVESIRRVVASIKSDVHNLTARVAFLESGASAVLATSPARQPMD